MKYLRMMNINNFHLLKIILPLSTNKGVTTGIGTGGGNERDIYNGATAILI